MWRDRARVRARPPRCARRHRRRRSAPTSSRWRRPGIRRGSNTSVPTTWTGLVDAESGSRRSIMRKEEPPRCFYPRDPRCSTLASFPLVTRHSRAASPRSSRWSRVRRSALPPVEDHWREFFPRRDCSAPRRGPVERSGDPRSGCSRPETNLYEDRHWSVFDFGHTFSPQLEAATHQLERRSLSDRHGLSATLRTRLSLQLGSRNDRDPRAARCGRLPTWSRT